jgi:hypothetical protein
MFTTSLRNTWSDMSIFQLPIGDLGGMLSLGCEAKTEYGTGEQKLGREGVPQWKVTLFSQKFREAISVTVTAPQKPQMPTDGQPVEVVGLEAGTYATTKGSAFYFTAQGVKAVQRA